MNVLYLYEHMNCPGTISIMENAFLNYFGLLELFFFHEQTVTKSSNPVILLMFNITYYEISSMDVYGLYWHTKCPCLLESPFVLKVIRRKCECPRVGLITLVTTQLSTH